MKTIILAMLVCASVVAGEKEIKLTSLTIGTNVYQNATVRRRNALEAMVKFDGGLTMVKIEKLPESIRTNFYDKIEAEKLSSERKGDLAKASLKVLEKRHFESESYKAKHFKVVDSKLVPIEQFESHYGTVKSVSLGVARIEVSNRRAILGRSKLTENQSVGAYSRVGSYETVVGYINDPPTLLNVRNLPNPKIGESVSFDACRSGGILDCGTPYEIKPFSKN